MDINNKKYISRNNLILFNDDFNDRLDDYINIINEHNTIFFGKSFNNNISILPPNITTIIFHSESEFNQEIKDFSYNLQKIVFGKNFSKSLEYFPVSLEELEFEPQSVFNNDLSNLPPSVKKITLGRNYSKPLNYLPFNLEYLKISSSYNEEIKVFPQKLKHLIFYEDFYTDKKIYIEDVCTSKNYMWYNLTQIDKNYEFEIKNLPPNLIEIKYPEKYSYPIENLPQSLKILKINGDYQFKKNIKKSFPDVKIYYY